MATYFTADTHFGHENIIGLTNRPFSSVEEMDETLISNWNEVVAPNDTVYHLGDFSFRNAKGADKYRTRLNGKIHLIRGNHDGHTLKHHSDLFESINDILEIKIDGQSIVLCHYPMREWHGCWRGWWHFFGHVHTRLNLSPLGYSLDVGVDSHSYRPIEIADVRKIFESRDNPFEGKRKPIGEALLKYRGLD